MKKKVILIAIAAVLVLNLTACKISSSKNNVESKYYSLNIDGQKEYVDEKSEEVAELTKFTEEFVKAQNEVDYRNPESYLKGIDFYISSVKAQKESYGYNDNLREDLTSYELVRKTSDYEVEEIEFYKKDGNRVANITYTYCNEIKNATEEYLEERERQLNSPYKLRYTTKMQQEDGNWRVVEVLNSEYVEE